MKNLTFFILTFILLNNNVNATEDENYNDLLNNFYITNEVEENIQATSQAIEHMHSLLNIYFPNITQTDENMPQPADNDDRYIGS